MNKSILKKVPSKLTGEELDELLTLAADEMDQWNKFYQTLCDERVRRSKPEPWQF